MLRAARDAGVKRVVVTSTFGAAGYGALAVCSRRFAADGSLGNCKWSGCEPEGRRGLVESPLIVADVDSSRERVLLC